MASRTMESSQFQLNLEWKELKLFMKIYLSNMSKAHSLEIS